MANPIKIMISSRCDSVIPFNDRQVTLTDLRQELKRDIEAQLVFGEKSFEVWINDGDAAAATADENSWEHCLRQADESEIFIALYNGEAGWAADGQDIGICHAELDRALRTGRTKVRLVALPPPTSNPKKADKERNDRLKVFIDKESLFRGSNVRTSIDAKRRVLQAIQESLLELARRGKMHSKKDKFDRGESLDWTKLNFSDRKVEIEKVLRINLSLRKGSEIVKDYSIVKIGAREVIFVPVAIPAALTVSAARELVGRPQLNDHVVVGACNRKNAVGPVHLIGCHRGVTEFQAASMLGNPDVVTVKSGFGVYAVDSIQKAQLVFLENCRDSASTRHMTQLFFDWLATSGESDLLVKRAESRLKITRTVMDHIKI